MEIIRFFGGFLIVFCAYLLIGRIFALISCTLERRFNPNVCSEEGLVTVIWPFVLIIYVAMGVVYVIAKILSLKIAD